MRSGGSDPDAEGEGPTLVLQGHVDVVPPGDPDRWAGDPFEPRIEGRHGRDVLVGGAPVT